MTEHRCSRCEALTKHYRDAARLLGRAAAACTRSTA